MYTLLPHAKAKTMGSLGSDIQSATTQPDVLEEVIFAGGCFWDLEAAFGVVNGVVMTATGYCGGNLPKPTRAEVMQKITGHTEVVKIFYDKRKVTFKLLCKIFWECHDPTDKLYLKFGIDTHYRSAIYYGNEEQRKQAQMSKIERQMKLNKRIVTKILPSNDFHLAENQHQKYFLQKSYVKVCESLSLRSTQQFVESQVACKLNGILRQKEKKAGGEDLKRYIESCGLSEQTIMVLEEILQEMNKDIC